MDFDTNPLGTICLWWFGIGTLWSLITMRRVFMRSGSFSLKLILLLWTALIWPFGMLSAVHELLFKPPTERMVKK